MATQSHMSCLQLSPVSRVESHTLLVLMDGNGRATRSETSGYNASTRKLVELCRDLRSSQRAKHVVACVLSRENISKREPPFFEELHEALVDFGAMVDAGVMDGIVIDVVGSLEPLRALGGHASACAADFEAIARLSLRAPSPVLHLSLAIDYGRDVALSTNAIVLHPAGVPTDEVFRTSSVDTTVHTGERDFLESIVRWAEASKLPVDTTDCPGATNYLRTAYHLFSTPEAAEVAAKYMILVALGDVLFDRQEDGESDQAQLHRLAASTMFLRDALSSKRVPIIRPNVAGAPLLESIARQWIVFAERFQHRASDAAFQGWVRALCDHYTDTVREYQNDITHSPAVAALCSEDEPSRMRAAQTILEQYVTTAPTTVAARIHQLVAVCLDNPMTNTNASLELRVWLYLLDVNTIGAGLAIRSAVLTVARDDITPVALFALEETLPLLDFRIRLANDASGFVRDMGVDRDAGKRNACSLLVPDGATGVALAEALMQAVRTIRHVCRILDGALDVSIDKLVAAWPEVGAWVSRSRKLGVSAYEAGHYTTLSSDAFTSLLATVGDERLAQHSDHHTIRVGA